MMLGLAAILVAAQGTQTLDTTFARWRSGPPIPAVAMAVVHRGRIIYSNVAGFANLEHRVPATLETRFDWASIAKQFTAFAIAGLAERGKLSTADPVQKYLPELDLDGATITLEQLIHHTAGLEDADGLMTLAGGKPEDPVTTADVVRVVLAQRHLRFAPGEQQSYGNGGYALLTEVIARVTGSPFEAWCDSTIFKPLGLASAAFAGPTDIVPDRAMPYVMRNGFRVSTVDSYFGAGGLVATVGDMARWTMHVMAPASQVAATRRLRERGHLQSGETIGYAWGLGWGEYRGLATLAHAGSGPATSAQMTIYPDQEFAVVVAAAGDLAPDVNTLARRAAELFLADQLGPVKQSTGPQMFMLSEETMRAAPPESEGVVVPEARLATYAGIYRFPDGEVMSLRPTGSQLEFGFNARPPWFPLFPLPDGRFVMMPLWDAYRFITDGSGKVTGMARERTPKSMRSRGDSVVVAERITLPRFDAAAALPYLGVYYSDELHAFYEVTFDGARLVLRHARFGSLPLLPLGGEEFGIDSRSVTKATFGRVGSDVVGMELRAFSWDARASFRKLPK